MDIEFAKKADKEEIISLWQEAFSEEREDVKKILNMYYSHFVVLKDEDKVCAMLGLIPVSINGDRGRYVYAVATKKEKRGLGYSSELLEFSKEFVKTNKEKFLILVPANQGLFDFYGKRGFKTINCIEKINVNCVGLDEIFEDIKRIDEREYFIKRQEKLKAVSYAEWSKADLFNIKKIYNGDFYYIEKTDAILFCFMYGEKLFVKEMLCEADKIDICQKILKNKFNPKEIEAVTMGNKPYAMILGKKYEKLYFNFAID